MEDAELSAASAAPSEPTIAYTRKAPPRAQPGSGHLHLSHPHRARFSSLSASYPLKLLAPDALSSQPPHIAICYTLAYGGGLVAGDVVSLRVEVDAGCGLILLTQGSTKLFKHRPGLRPLSHQIIRQPIHSAGVDSSLTRQRLHVELKPHSFLFLLPDSVSPFRGSRYSQAQRFVLPVCRTASIVILDWFNSGRGQRRTDRLSIKADDEEIWAMEYYASTNEVLVGDTAVMRERMVLDNDTETTSVGLSRTAKHLSPYHVYATVLILGPHTASLRTHLQRLSLATSQMQVSRPSELLWAYSPTDEQGGVLRMAGKEVEEIKGWLREAMAGGGMKELVGDGLWPRVI
ncbi:UreD urease accessory protein-domain-containing protein [Dioszegia hungarica]|uniref:UreD urease accessory protein-domain-containing protein n=1 Tax=Dioszegia hungarica TaxID=4972 RepID=A0AA38LQK1_9TREE|nr:UreD urease accessory protein-domain-containing protein [Dioszegia hungarica]KAI9632025.1 UreD urease accessory protein-domain-containing protein [Dioszegia hungarica]